MQMLSFPTPLNLRNGNVYLVGALELLEEDATSEVTFRRFLFYIIE